MCEPFRVSDMIGCDRLALAAALQLRENGVASVA